MTFLFSIENTIEKVCAVSRNVLYYAVRKAETLNRNRKGLCRKSKCAILYC